ncbi:hypothetical protein SAMN02799624_05175 [Paenibacillus sp. UNC496MF]|uniref:hypothetical protein n=1 Tax=Paenibacillus sp. UNC496MF TaxID=1502753 RepID=UPI0008E69E06|nr:hypothetical protein [Paenibacillus sp. UNC496MF]SFJ59622.1 hypothetical protein SAMN02799624_05175 [Paenibacillus sp. UNC496MF]
MNQNKSIEQIDLYGKEIPEVNSTVLSAWGSRARKPGYPFCFIQYCFFVEHVYTLIWNDLVILNTEEFKHRFEKLV